MSVLPVESAVSEGAFRSILSQLFCGNNDTIKKDSVIFSKKRIEVRTVFGYNGKVIIGLRFREVGMSDLICTKGKQRSSVPLPKASDQGHQARYGSRSCQRRGRRPHGLKNRRRRCCKRCSVLVWCETLNQSKARKIEKVVQNGAFWCMSRPDPRN